MGSGDDSVADDVARVVDATRVIGAIIAESLATLDPPLTMPQWRVLVLAADGTCNVSAVAEDLRVHMSNATRLCDRLVTAGLLARRRADHDRRHVLLAHTRAGAELYARAMEHRRRLVAEAMGQMEQEQRTALAAALDAFTAAVGSTRSASARL